MLLSQPSFKRCVCFADKPHWEVLWARAGVPVLLFYSSNCSSNNNNHRPNCSPIITNKHSHPLLLHHLPLHRRLSIFHPLLTRHNPCAYQHQAVAEIRLRPHVHSLQQVFVLHSRPHNNNLPNLNHNNHSRKKIVRLSPHSHMHMAARVLSLFTHNNLTPKTRHGPYQQMFNYPHKAHPRYRSWHNPQIIHRHFFRHIHKPSVFLPSRRTHTAKGVRLPWPHIHKRTQHNSNNKASHRPSARILIRVGFLLQYQLWLLVPRQVVHINSSRLTRVKHALSLPPVLSPSRLYRLHQLNQFYLVPPPPLLRPSQLPQQ
jgi:hypothetical protein